MYVLPREMLNPAIPNIIINEPITKAAISQLLILDGVSLPSSMGLTCSSAETLGAAVKIINTPVTKGIHQMDASRPQNFMPATFEPVALAVVANDVPRLRTEVPIEGATGVAIFAYQGKRYKLALKQDT